MKVLLTGASGFVGSHVLDALRASSIPTALLLRPSSSRRFIQPHLPLVELRQGALDDLASLESALGGVTHVIHCAGITKARHGREFHRVNAVGTRHLVEAINKRTGVVRRLVHVSSLAARGPATSAAPAVEMDVPRPVSAYGHSKLAAEQIITESCRSEFVILRPPAVYGPRDDAFLGVFRAIRRGVMPGIGPRAQELSLVFARDLAEVAVASLCHPDAHGMTVNVASARVVTDEELCAEIAAALGVKTRRLRLPLWVLRLVCGLAATAAMVTGRPSILACGKHHELSAPGWVCDTARLRERLGLDCPTSLGEGVRRAIEWYREQGCL